MTLALVTATPVALFTAGDDLWPLSAKAWAAVAILSVMTGMVGHGLLYYENTVGGHAGASDNEQFARSEALIYSYLWDQLGRPAAKN